MQERDGGSEICLDASFDLGIPTLADLLDPIAEASFRANILRILSGLFGSAELLADDAATTAAL